MMQIEGRRRQNIMNIDYNTNYIEVRTTLESKCEAEKLANLLVDKHLVASANLHKTTSISLRHKRKCTDKRVELSCITRSEMYRIVQGFIEQNLDCSYCPIICIPIMGISQDFADWVDKKVYTLHTNFGG